MKLRNLFRHQSGLCGPASLASKSMESSIVLHCDGASILSYQIIAYKASNEMIFEDDQFEIESFSTPLVLVGASEWVGQTTFIANRFNRTTGDLVGNDRVAVRSHIELTFHPLIAYVNEYSLSSIQGSIIGTSAIIVRLMRYRRIGRRRLEGFIASKRETAASSHRKVMLSIKKEGWRRIRFW